MDTRLEANVRADARGKGAARKLRASGRLPGVVYGPTTTSMVVDIDPVELEHLYKRTGDRNTLVSLVVGDATYPVLVREVQRHPLTREMLHVDFYVPPTDRRIEVLVPIEPVGRPAGASLGGRLRVIRRTVKASCPYNAIPKSFVVDVSSMHIDDIVRASEIATPDGVDLVFDSDFNVLTVYGKRGGK
ncbi:MAG: large subunit ribosomal protein L25 [Myxococcota bacterium]|jgi:large subunit ribosomal protein L25